MKTTTFLAAILAAAYPAHAEEANLDERGTETTSSASSTSSGIEEASAAPTLGAQVVQGCFSSWGDLIFNSTPSFNSKSKCAYDACYAGGFKVAATTAGNECYCGNSYPPKDTLADDSKCDTPCPGYGLQACGGVDYYTVYNTGIMLDVDYATDNETSSASSTPTASVIASSTVVSGGQTSVVYVTATPSTGTTTPKKSSTSVGGIIAGVVVGVVVIAAAFGGLFFYMRNKRNREIEEEHRRNAAVNAFMKPPGSSGGYSVDTDARLDPVMAQRRLSSGSIADNQDYSRRILRVTNA